MAAKAQKPVGSMPWIHAEKENIRQLIQQEKEEVIYPAQHEVEWLNEHMAEIFSKSERNVTDLFKTPGKMKGKTPRTGRTRNVFEPRIPLSDVFSSKPKPDLNPKGTSLAVKAAASFRIAHDKSKDVSSESPKNLPKHYADSGYHGSTCDETDMENLDSSSAVPRSDEQKVKEAEKSPKIDGTGMPRISFGKRTTEGSFHSANETAAAKHPPQNPQSGEIYTGHGAQDDNAASPQQLADPREKTRDHESSEDTAIDKGAELLRELDEIGSPSGGSTPDQPLLRKSSLTFATLPPREPLNAKKSFGVRDSRIDQLNCERPDHSSLFSWKPANSSAAATSAQGYDQADEAVPDPKVHYEADTTLKPKISTQTLQEKIDMLGRSQASRTSKSIPSAAALAASNLRKSEAAVKAAKEAASVEAAENFSTNDEDDDWIKPLGSTSPGQDRTWTNQHSNDTMKRTDEVMDGGISEPEDEQMYDSVDEMDFQIKAPELVAYEERMRTPSPCPGEAPGLGHAKSASTATLASPNKQEMAPERTHSKTISVSNPAQPSTTPQGSPRRMLDMPLSASKSKLQSIMKTAKGLFTSSAGVSAAAKIENLSPRTLHLASNDMPGLYPNLVTALEEKPLPPSPPVEGRRTRNSAEREREEKRRQKTQEHLEVARDDEKHIASQHTANERTIRGGARAGETLCEGPRRPLDEAADNGNVPVSYDTHTSVPATRSASSSVQAIQRKAQRLAKPTREPPPKSKPQPMSIRVGSTMSQRMPVTNSSLASTLHDTLPTTNNKKGATSKKVGNTSISSTASTSTAFKSSATAPQGKPKALLAAERKKEADERQAQRKLDLKREAERKRAAHQEEARRQEQGRRVELERKERERIAAEQAKKGAQQQAIEKRRQDQARKLEQQRAANMPHESVQAGSLTALSRNEMTAPRPISRIGTASTLGRSLINQNHPTNPAKPPKRTPEDGGALQQPESKRRRTEDKISGEGSSRPTISGAPIRQSNMGKKLSVYPPGYVAAPNGPLMSQTQHQQQQQQASGYHTVKAGENPKIPNGSKIVFAEAPNPPAYPAQHFQNQKTPTSHQAPSYHQPHSQQQKQQPSAHPAKVTLQLVKSSPQQKDAQCYTPGETIALPEIPTDSEEDSDSDSEYDDHGGNGGGDNSSFPLPKWVSPNTLSNQLLAQESIDGDAVFGPIAPLRMEEIFAKGSNKDRLKKFRERTSSANWALSGDGLTIEEVRADREMRERMRVQGGWRYGGD